MHAVACPFFLPLERAFTIGWSFPNRLPLRAGFCGTCRAGRQEVTPTEAELRDFCNLGYAGQCSRMPPERRADCVRFAVASDQGVRITMHYIYERDHAPVEWGLVDYDCAARRWFSPLQDEVVQRQAECYLAMYLERRPRQDSATRLPKSQPGR